ncbi:unnamed protein product, partial [Owenia fusiformis]
GTTIGNIASLALSGLLCNVNIDNGWPMIYYFFGGMTALWFLLWTFLVYDNPKTHPRITEEERLFIEQYHAMSSAGFMAGKSKFPFKSIAKSRPVWAIIIAQSCNSWTSYTLGTSMPLYMEEVLRFDVHI